MQVSCGRCDELPVTVVLQGKCQTKRCDLLIFLALLALDSA